MRTLRRAAPLAVLAAVIAIGAACAPVKSPAGGRAISFGGAHPQAQEIYYLVNNERAARGLGPANWNDQLGGLAQGWAEYMAGSGNFVHQNLHAVLGDPAFAGFSGLGENIIAGHCGMSAAELHYAWMSSWQHAANILGNFHGIGIGIACNGGTLYAVQDFGR